MEENKTNFQGFFDSALILGYLTVIGYYSAYKYEEGYNSHFKVPSIFLDEIGLINILFAVAGISSFLMIYLLFHNLFQWFYPASDSPVAETIRRIYWVIIICSVVIYYAWDKNTTIAFGVLILCILFLNFIFPLLVHPKTKGYKNKLRKQLEINGDPIEKIILHHIKTGSHKLYLLILVSFFIIGACASIIGQINATKAKKFTVVTNKNTYIVFNVKGDLLLVAPVDLKNKVLTPKYKLIKNDDLNFENKKIDHLEID
jgi:hypothetical protein